MKRLRWLTALVAVSIVPLGILLAQSTTPLPPWFSRYMEGVKVKDATSGEEGIFAAKTARFVYDVATDGGTVAAHGLGVRLPARSVIIRSYFKIITQFTDDGTGTVALSCEDANNIKTATDITGSSANAFVEGASTGASSAFVRGIAAECEITATVATDAQTAGKLIGWVHYVLEN